jgi:alkylated DNA repair protein alkB family protein 8
LTRKIANPQVREFMERLPRGAVVADVGCGNGKYFGVRRDAAVLGSDRSTGEQVVGNKQPSGKF